MRLPVPGATYAPVLYANERKNLRSEFPRPTPAMFQPKSSGGPDGALLFKEGHLIRNGAFPAQCTSQQHSVVGGSVSGKGQPAHNGMPEPTQQPPFKPATTTAAIASATCPSWRKGNLLDKSLELDVEEGDLEEVGCLETDSRNGDQTQGPIPAMCQPKSSEGPDGALLFKEGHLTRNGAFPAQCTSQQQSVVGGSVSGKRPASSQWHARANPAAPLQTSNQNSSNCISNLPELVI
ncbi:hypothetical protein MRX96_048865 [Rhipicephalus microplus]